MRISLEATLSSATYSINAVVWIRLQSTANTGDVHCVYVECIASNVTFEITIAPPKMDSSDITQGRERHSNLHPKGMSKSLSHSFITNQNIPGFKLSYTPQE
jgi:hypothetical protein